MKKVQIERKDNLSPGDFVRDHLQGAGKPVIVTDATQDWPARSKWTFQFFKTAYGSDFAFAPLGVYSKVGKLTRLDAYIDFLQKPGEELGGFWLDKTDGRPLQTVPPPAASPPYLLDWHGFQRHPELYDDIKPAPYFVADWLSALNPTLRDICEWTCGKDYSSIYIGPEGTLSILHQDFGHTHSYLAQMQGRKRAILFSPEESEFLYAGQVDPEQPDFQRFGLLDRATAYECVLEPGEVLFMPADWWHCVRALEKSITLSHNFFNDVNVNEHLSRLLRRLPKLVQGFDKYPAWREELRVHWQSKGFADPKHGDTVTRV